MTTSKTTGTGKDSARTDVAVAVSSTDFKADANNSGTFKLDFYGDGSSTGTTFDGVRTNVAVQVTVDVNKKDGAADSFTITGMKKLFVPAALADGTDSYDVSYSGNVITVTRKHWVSATKTETYYYVFTLKVQ